LNEQQIRWKDDLMSDDKKEVMNDGCGQISKAMARSVANCLGLTYIPSGFQARFGGAKGFWIIERYDSQEPWIEVYTSQKKWDRNPNTLNPGERDVDHRTFEVVGWVKPLKSATLNLQFLPILEDRGKTKKAMRESIANLLKDGLKSEIEKQQVAMDSPEAFRRWVSDSGFQSRMEERLKFKEVPFRAALPESQEEKLNFLLDSGFDPKKLRFVKDLAWKAYTAKCDHLKEKMNITVGKSTYAYIAIDFEGILEPNEVHIGFSSAFKDETSGWTDTMLDGQDILVTRSPAHYVSDIQKVKAVWKRELKALKDVAVFSSKGELPLASMLSGGDYDGDIAWICWEPSIVDNFRNADMPVCPDLIKQGYIDKDRTAYSDLTGDSESDPIPLFLETSFDFILRENLLGLCTSFKEQYCYTVGSVSNHDAVFLSTLLSSLVDQAKQGLTLTQKSWSNIKDNVIKTRIRQPAYKGNQLYGNATHIIDYLKFVVAEKTIEATLTDFHNSLQTAKYWDEDLIYYSSWAIEKSKSSPDWADLLNHLKRELEELKKEWKSHFSNKRDGDAGIDDFPLILSSIYEKYIGILPESSNPLASTLLPPCIPEDYSSWALLKASVLFASYNQNFVSNFVWWMAGKQLAYLKASALAQNRGGINVGVGSFHVVVPRMYAMLKPDSVFVKMLKTDEHEPKMWELIADGRTGISEEELDDDDF
jgi:hypothetical protein